MKGYFLNIVVLFLISSCGPFRILQGESEPIANMKEPTYRVRVGDKLTISILDHPDLSVGSIFNIYNSNEVYGKWILVKEDSTIDIPGIQNFEVVGKTLSALEEEITLHHSVEVRSPEVVVRVLDLQATILGEVKNPGSYIIDRDKMDLLQLLGIAGGLNYYARIQSVEIIRQLDDGVHKYTIDLSEVNSVQPEKIWVYPDDVVYIPAKQLQHTEKRLGSIIPIASAITAIVLIVTLL